MWNKIKAFLQNRIVITVEFILIGLCCAGLIIAGIKVEEIAKIPALVAGILGLVADFIVYITSIISKK